MPIVKTIGGVGALMASGKLGLPNGLGLIRPGRSKYGDFFPSAGIYRRNGRWKKYEIVKMRHYFQPTYRSPKQRFYADFFRDIVSIFHALPPETVAKFRTRGLKYKMTAYNCFNSEYLTFKPSHVGNYRVGFTKLGLKMWIP
jgi:hypothetical protein